VSQNADHMVSEYCGRPKTDIVPLSQRSSSAKSNSLVEIVDNFSVFLGRGRVINLTEGTAPKGRRLFG
jgi:hypothetical protein